MEMTQWGPNHNLRNHNVISQLTLTSLPCRLTRSTIDNLQPPECAPGNDGKQVLSLPSPHSLSALPPWQDAKPRSAPAPVVRPPGRVGSPPSHVAEFPRVLTASSSLLLVSSPVNLSSFSLAWVTNILTAQQGYYYFSRKASPWAQYKKGVALSDSPPPSASLFSTLHPH